MSKRTIGIDEAGRGPAIGPMVLAAVCLDTQGAGALSRLGVRDSKSFGSPARARALRAELAPLIEQHAVQVAVRVVTVAEIDRRVARGELNMLEREVARELLEQLPVAERIVADGKTLFAGLRTRYPHLEAHNKGESKHCSVAAASILAKVTRDRLFAEFAARYEPEYGPITGGGYCNPGTRSFLAAYAERNGCLPPEARRSWPHDYLADLLDSQKPSSDDQASEACEPLQLSLL